MGVVIVALGGVVGRVAMPALAGLLIVIGCATVKPAKVIAVGRTGAVPLTVMTITLILTLVIPLQYAVLAGVGLSVLLVVIGQSTRLSTRRLNFRDDGRIAEGPPPAELGAGDVVVLQPYGAVFFATATVLREQMPTVTPASRHSVVVLRLRGTDPAGVTLLEVLRTYAAKLGDVGSRLMIVTDNAQFLQQLDSSGVAAVATVYTGTEFVGETVRRAEADARRWVDEQTAGAS